LKSIFALSIGGTACSWAFGAQEAKITIAKNKSTNGFLNRRIIKGELKGFGALKNEKSNM